MIPRRLLPGAAMLGIVFGAHFAYAAWWGTGTAGPDPSIRSKIFDVSIAPPPPEALSKKKQPPSTFLTESSRD